MSPALAARRVAIGSALVALVCTGTLVADHAVAAWRARPV